LPVIDSSMVWLWVMRKRVRKPGVRQAKPRAKGAWLAEFDSRRAAKRVSVEGRAATRVTADDPGSVIRMCFTARAALFELGAFFSGSWPTLTGGRLVRRRRRDRGVRGTALGVAGESNTLCRATSESRFRSRFSPEPTEASRRVVKHPSSSSKASSRIQTSRRRLSSRPTESQVLASSLREAVDTSNVSRACE
jgi:hypothetical protein